MGTGFRFSVLISIILCSSFVVSAGMAISTPPKHRISEKPLAYISRGVFIGGEADQPLSLLDVKVRRSKSGGRERLELMFADREGLPLRGRLGFSHIAVEKNPPRIVIDLSQVLRTSTDGRTLQNLFSRSKMVAGSEMTMDPHDHSTNISLFLKAPQNVSVFTKPDSIGNQRLIIDIREKETKVRR